MLWACYTTIPWLGSAEGPGAQCVAGGVNKRLLFAYVSVANPGSQNAGDALADEVEAMIVERDTWRNAPWRGIGLPYPKQTPWNFKILELEEI